MKSIITIVHTFIDYYLQRLLHTLLTMECCKIIQLLINKISLNIIQIFKVYTHLRLNTVLDES